MPENSDSTYIVTGASAGIGRAVAIALADRGLRVVAVARTESLLESLSAACGAKLTAVATDLSSSAGIEQVVAAIKNESEIAGVVHAAASLIQLDPYQQIDTIELVEDFRIHVSAPMALYQAISQSHQVRRMLFIDSYSASTLRVGWGAYSIIKAAAQMAARCATEELSRTNTIRVFPGAVNTQIIDAVLASDTESATVYAGMKERGEVAEPADVAAFMVSLLVDASDELIRSQAGWDYNNLDDKTRMEIRN